MTKIILANTEFDCVVAVTPEEQARGLMGCSWPPPIMLFPSEPQIRKFWMKNTPSPLDIVFCKNSKIISICNGEPFSTRQVGPDAECDLVAEFPAGTMKLLGIKEGDKIKINYDNLDRKKILKTCKS